MSKLNKYNQTLFLTDNDDADSDVESRRPVTSGIVNSYMFSPGLAPVGWCTTSRTDRILWATITTPTAFLNRTRSSMTWLTVGRWIVRFIMSYNINNDNTGITFIPKIFNTQNVSNIIVLRKNQCPIFVKFYFRITLTVVTFTFTFSTMTLLSLLTFVHRFHTSKIRPSWPFGHEALSTVFVFLQWRYYYCWPLSTVFTQVR